MKLYWKVLWSQIWEEVAAGWLGLAFGAILVFLCALGWASATANHGNPDLVAIARRTAIYCGALLAAASVLGIALVVRGHRKGWLAQTVAERTIIAVVRTLFVLGVTGIVLGLVIYGGIFLHIELILKILHLD